MKHLIITASLTALCAVTAAAQSNVAAAPASVSKTAPTPTPSIVQQVRVAPGQLGGHILNNTTRRPVAGHAFQLLDANGTKVTDLTTSFEGTYTTPALQKGNYTLLVRDDLKLHLAVDETATISNLDIVMPQGPAKKPTPQNPSQLPAAPGGAAPVLPPPAPIVAPGIGLGTWAVAAGGAAAIAVPVVANSGGSDSPPETPVSGAGLGVRR